MTARTSLSLLLAIGAAAAPATAQRGLLVVAHGGGPGWNAGVRALVEQVRWQEGPVATAFLMGAEAEQAGWSPALAKLLAAGVREIVVVPLMVSSHGGHYHQIRFYAGELDSLPAELREHAHERPVPPPVPTRVTAALDDAPELGVALLERWRELSAADRRRPLVLVAHGPNADTEAALWLRNLSRAAEPIRAGSKLPVAVQLLRDDAPAPIRGAAVAELRATIQRFAAGSADSVVVLPVLVSTGAIDQVKIPRDLEGLPIVYRSAQLVRSTAIARWIERSAGQAITP